MKLMQSYATALGAAALLATQAGAQATLAAQTPALSGATVQADTADAAGAACLVTANSCRPTLAPTSNDVADPTSMSIDTMAIALDELPANHLDGSSGATAQMGILRWKVKWRGAAERVLGAANPTLAGHPGPGQTLGAYEATTLSAAGLSTTWWAQRWAPIKTTKADGGAEHLAGVAFEGCAAVAASHVSPRSTNCAGAAHRKFVVNALTKGGAPLALAGARAPKPLDAAYEDLAGPVVKLAPGGTKYLTKLTATVVTMASLCAQAKLVVTAWSGTVTAEGVVTGNAAVSTLVVNSAGGGLTNTHAARPWHQLDVPGWTPACVLHYRCPAAGAALSFTSTAATAADCAGTATTNMTFPRKRATLAAGKEVKVEAFIEGNAWAAGTAAQKLAVTATGTVLVKHYADCTEITAVTATPLSATVTATAGKTYTQAVTFAHNRAAEWTQAGMCGEAVTVSAGTNKAWVTWAAGVATVVVPADAPTAKTTVTIAAAYPSAGGGSASGVATGAGSFVLTLDVTALPKPAGGAGKAGGAADVAGTAASVVAGVLGGALFAAAFAPAPAATLSAGAGASAAAGAAPSATDA